MVWIFEKARKSEKVKSGMDEVGKEPMPKWIYMAADAYEGKIISLPARDDIDYEVSEHLIVELYSK